MTAPLIMIGITYAGPMAKILLDSLWHHLSHPTAPVWIAAISTTILALVAFIVAFRDELRSRFLRPELAFEIQKQPPYCYKIPNIPKNDRVISAYYFTARVRNDGKAPARGVTVFATSLKKLEKRGDTESWEPVKGFLPMELVWAHVRHPLTATRFIERQVIPQDLFAHFDVGCVEPTSETKHAEIRNLVGNEPNETVFKIDTVVTPNTLTNWLRKGTYRLCLVASATNAKPVKQHFTITNSGVWTDSEEEMFSDHLTIEKT
jgi:hypothetical protein